MINALFNSRSLTGNEIKLLEGVFSDTLVYDDLEVGQNILQAGGEGNSITPFGTPYMSQKIWSTDYGTAPDSWQWVFVHEFAHVWQYLTGLNKITAAVATWLVMDDYETEAYNYDLTKQKNLMGYNFESQASIIADYFYVSKKKLAPLHNIGSLKAEAHYIPFMTHVWNNPAPMALMRRGLKRMGF